MGRLDDLAAKIEADRAAVAEIGGPINSSKGQAEHTIAAMIALGLEGSAARMRKAVGEVEEAESIRAALEGALTKAHFMVVSAIQGTMGPGAAGSGAVVPLTRIDADGAPKAGLDAVPPHLRQDPAPTGDDLAQPIDRRKSKSLFRESVAKADQVDDASKFVERTFESAWQKIHGEPSPAKAQENAVAMTQTGSGPVVTDTPAPQITLGGALMGTFVGAVVTAKAAKQTIEQTVQQFERFHNWVRKAEDRGQQKR